VGKKSEQYCILTIFQFRKEKVRKIKLILFHLNNKICKYQLGRVMVKMLAKEVKKVQKMQHAPQQR